MNREKHISSAFDRDLEAIKAAGYDTTTIVVVINTATLSEVSPVAGGDVSNGDPVINVVA